jgi:serine/threonine-protein kinase
VYDVSSEEDPERYLVVELIRGTTLRKVLVEHGHLPAEIGAAIGIQVARGLNHAHRQGVVHRDVKPENVLIASEVGDKGRRKEGSPNVRVKITDFGIAKLLDAQGVTSTGQVLGSPAHMAPEQIEGGDVSARADVFGLGVLLYECMVGSLPFDGKNPAQVLRRVLDGSFTPPERARPTVGAGWSRIVERALAHKPEDRYPSADDLADALEGELSLLGFPDAAAELEAYLDDTQGYEEGYTARIVASLTELGREARQRQEMQRAAGLFNRALAFRPDNTQLLAEVAGLARRQRFRRTLRTGAMVTGGVLVILFAGMLGFQQFSKAGADPRVNDEARKPTGESDRSPVTAGRTEPKQSRAAATATARASVSALAPLTRQAAARCRAMASRKPSRSLAVSARSSSISTCGRDAARWRHRSRAGRPR